jgi:acyl-CoA synthetase (AMP-forming)/AMP-acid ligase II
MPTPYAALARQAAATPDAVLLAAPPVADLPGAPDGLAITYAEAAARVEALRRSYAAAGYGRGARVALLLENRPAFIFHWLALNALGVALHPINPDLRRDDLAYQLSVAQPDLAVVLPERRAQMTEAGMTVSRVRVEGEAPPPCRVPVDRQEGDAQDECALLFTSGTTAKPKGCVLSNAYFTTMAGWYTNQGGTAAMRPGQETILTPLPLFHMNALANSCLGAITIGATLVQLDRFHARRWWRTVADSNATLVHYLGVMPAILLKLDPEDAERAHTVRFGFGAGVDPRHQRTFEDRFGFPLVEAWAMTETGAGGVTTTATGPRHVGQRCIGRPHAGMAVRLVDDEGRPVDPGTPGELLVRATGADPRHGFFTRYLNDPTATDEAWAGGWFHTGDVVREGPDGSLFFVDRKKNIVRRSGENIAVVEVEGALELEPDIAGAAVAPVPDEIRGEEVCALIRLRDGRPADPDAVARRIMAGCAERLAYYKVPGWIAFVDVLPVTATQKLQRGEIRTLAARIVAEGPVVDLRAEKGKLRTPGH